MKKTFYSQLVDRAVIGKEMSFQSALDILVSDGIGLLPLLNAAYDVRKKFYGNTVTIHVINNAQNGYCPEDCHYCAQARSSTANIETYAIKSDREFLNEAKAAYESGAYRYCMVFAGRGPTQQRIDHLARLVKEIKFRYPIQVCVSAGLLDAVKAKTLKDAGLDRLNHNLNTSARYYGKICMTHTYEDRLKTLGAAREAGLQICSGVILGMGEKAEDIFEMAMALRKIRAESIPVNFFIPIEGVKLRKRNTLSPEFCLRALCLFRFMNPRAEIRIAAGRELHLRSMEVMALYPANSLFLDGYLNAKGEDRLKTFQMIKDAGFTVQSERSLDTLIANERSRARKVNVEIKDLTDLRPDRDVPVQRK
jgi:biotin synthase